MAKEADVVFSLDTTGSMHFAIEAMKEVIKTVAENYIQNRVQVRIGLVEFRDSVNASKMGTHPWDPQNTDLLSIQHFEFESGVYFTENMDMFRRIVDQLVADGGGPTPESSYDSIYTAISQSQWRQNAHRVIIHITDAPPNVPDLVCRDAEHLVEQIQHFEGLDQFHVICPKEYQHWYDDLNKSKKYVDSSKFTKVTVWDLGAGTEDLVEALRKVTKTSSDDIGGEVLISREPEELVTEIVPSENPFDDDGGQEEIQSFDSDEIDEDSDDFIFDD